MLWSLSPAFRTFQVVLVVLKNPPAHAGNTGDTGSFPWCGKSPWRGKWKPTLVFLPGKFHGQRSLAGYSLWGHKELDATKHTCFYSHIWSLRIENLRYSREWHEKENREFMFSYVPERDTGACQGCVLSPSLFNLHAEYIMRNTGLEEAQAGIKIARRNTNNLRYADDTTLMAESEEELKASWWKWKRLKKLA